MEEQGSAGGAERQVAKLVQDDEVGVGKASRNLPGPSLKLFLFEGVDEFDSREEPNALAVMFDAYPADRTKEPRAATGTLDISAGLPALRPGTPRRASRRACPNRTVMIETLAEARDAGVRLTARCGRPGL
jgi:hypothetical protein